MWNVLSICIIEIVLIPNRQTHFSNRKCAASYKKCFIRMFREIYNQWIFPNLFWNLNSISHYTIGIGIIDIFDVNFSWISWISLYYLYLNSKPHLTIGTCITNIFMNFNGIYLFSLYYLHLGHGWRLPAIRNSRFLWWVLFWGALSSIHPFTSISKILCHRINMKWTTSAMSLWQYCRYSNIDYIR